MSKDNCNGFWDIVFFNCLLSSNYPPLRSFLLVPSKNPGQPEIRNLWDHIFVKQDVARFQVSVDNLTLRVFVKT